MGINIGAFFAPLACGYLGMSENWVALWFWSCGHWNVSWIDIVHGEELKMEYLTITETNQMSIKKKRCMD